jgi:hypothetical protein
MLELFVLRLKKIFRPGIQDFNLDPRNSSPEKSGSAWKRQFLLRAQKFWGCTSFFRPIL